MALHCEGAGGWGVGAIILYKIPPSGPHIEEGVIEVDDTLTYMYVCGGLKEHCTHCTHTRMS